MSLNQQVVEQYMDGFRKSDHRQILACLAEDVEWDIPGWLHLAGREAFDREIENEAFVGSPVIQIKRLIEQDNVVIAEGSVQSTTRDGSAFHALFCDVFEFQAGKIQRLTSYLVSV